MTKKDSSTPANVRTRRALLGLLKQQGPQDAHQLAKQLNISAMAVRQHLYELQAEKLVTFTEQPRPRGRPAKLWQVTREADRHFPNAHAELTVGLIDAIQQAFGSSGMDEILRLRGRCQMESYRHQMPKRASLARKAQILAEIRTREGYMAEVQPCEGGYLLIENHCPICTAANHCMGLCSTELEVFQAVLGEDVSIERTEHIVSGARRCVYRLEAKSKMKQS